jgi:hypothetical protein
VAPAAHPPALPLVIEQRSCQYQPRVLVAQGDQIIQLRSNDQFVHRVRAGEAVVGGVLSLGTPPVEVTGPRAGESLRLGSDLHPWMTATVIGTDNPCYAVTDSRGRYQVAGLTAGTYTVEVWHERFGTQRAMVRVGADQPAPIVNFTYGKVPIQPAVDDQGDAWRGQDRCRLSREGSPVARACKEGGIQRAKALMKLMQKQGKAAGLKFECDECHRDESAGSWTLKDGAEDKFKKLLAAIR